jgi:hypothetical protein
MVKKMTFPSISIGEIIQVQEQSADDSSNLLRYVVRVENGYGSSTFVSNVYCSTFLGGIADGLKIYRRATVEDGKQFKINEKSQFGVGDRVVVAFINNDARRGIIIGGTPRVVDKVDLPEPDVKKPQMRFQYLGMVFDIDTKGQLTITHNGAPEITDSPNLEVTPDEKKVSTLTFKDDSSFVFTDANKQSIMVDSSNKKIELISDKEKVSIDQTGSIKVEASKDVTIKAPKVAIGTSSTELFDLIDKLLEALQQAAPQFVQTPVGIGVLDPNLLSTIVETKTKISQIKGKIE